MLATYLGAPESVPDIRWIWRLATYSSSRGVTLVEYSFIKQRCKLILTNYKPGVHSLISSSPNCLYS
jgi:hypothetical protein